MKKYLLGLFAIALAIGFSAFTTNTTKTDNDKAVVDYYFNSLDISEARVASSYQTWSSQSCPSGTALPCRIQFNTNTYATLQIYLNSFASDQAVVNAAITKKAD